MTEFWADVVELLRLDLLGAILLAVLYGGAVGLERELQGKPAGLRTNILICIGATLFTRLSVTMVEGAAAGDPSRIAAQVVTGVGFLGAGTILHARGNISGLTSAATIWVVAAIGVALGAGATLEATGVTILLLVVLGGLGRLERRLRIGTEVSHLELDVPADPAILRTIRETVAREGLELIESRSALADEGRMDITVTMRGPQRLHDRARVALLKVAGAHRIADEEE